MTVHVCADANDLARTIAVRMSALIAQVQRSGRRPRVVLTGGTIAAQAYHHLSDDQVDWSNVDLYWGDERFVPSGHVDRNDQQADDAFIQRLGVPEAHVHRMPAHGCDVSMDVAARAYEAQLPSEPFDLVLLGMGPDGHVASLFPGSDQLGEAQRRVVAVFDSPKPPAQRLSLTFKALNNTEATWLLVSGEAKADAVAAALSGADISRIPAAGVQGRSETAWLLDEEAAKELNQ